MLTLQVDIDGRRSICIEHFVLVTRSQVCLMPDKVLFPGLLAASGCRGPGGRLAWCCLGCAEPAEDTRCLTKVLQLSMFNDQNCKGYPTVLVVVG